MASLIVGTIDAPRPEAEAVDVPAGSGFDGAREDKEADLPGAQPVETPAAAPRAEAPGLDDLGPLDKADTLPAGLPETGSPDSGLTAPTENGNSPDAPAGADMPVQSDQPGAAPQAPVPDADLSISTEPAQPAPPAQPEDSGFAQTAPPNVTTDEPVQPVPPKAEPIPVPVVIVPLPDDQVEQPAPEDATPDAEEGAPPAPRAGEAVPLPSVTDPAAPDEARPRIGTPVGTLTDRAETAQTAPVVMTPATPFETYAEPFANPEGKPVMAIVLIDRGDSKIGIEALSSFPYPLSFAVDATSPMGQAAMARYRKAGFEVLALSDIPLGATPADTEMLLRATLRELPEVVAVMEGDGSGLQSDKAVSDQVTGILSETGHGLVLFPKGLNTAQKLAAKSGVVAATVFRDFDSKGQNASSVRRFLDQAAFRAGQEEGGVIMVGRLRPETISALLLWGLQDRASRVALAPVSAVLKEVVR